MAEPNMFESGYFSGLFENPEILLSASVPYRRNIIDRDGRQLTQKQLSRNRRFVRTSYPNRIRRAVTELCRQTFSRNWNLVFGGHPAISPLVLSAAQLFVPTEHHRKRVAVFQSAYFENQIPEDTRKLAVWGQGELLVTEARRTEADSLDLMRNVMVASQNLMACVLIGGMEGVLKEGRLFHENHPNQLLFPIESTGSAAFEWFRTENADEDIDEATAIKDVSYPREFSMIFKTLDERPLKSNL